MNKLVTTGTNWLMKIATSTDTVADGLDVVGGVHVSSATSTPSGRRTQKRQKRPAARQPITVGLRTRIPASFGLRSPCFHLRCTSLSPCLRGSCLRGSCLRPGARAEPLRRRWLPSRLRRTSHHQFALPGANRIR